MRIEYYNDVEKEELQKQIDGGDAVAMFTVAYFAYHGYVGYSQNFDAAFALFSRAGALGHVFALCRNAVSLQCGQDLVAARKLYIKAANRECKSACIDAAVMFQHGYGGFKNLYLAAFYFYKGDEMLTVEKLKITNPMDICPWTRWKPDAEIHFFVPDHVHNTIWTWLLIAKRSQLPKDLNNVICSFICTRNGWE